MHFLFWQNSYSVFDRAVRWIDDIEHSRVDELQMLLWARRSAVHVDTLLAVLQIWAAVESLSPEQLQRLDRLSQMLNEQGNVVWLSKSAEHRSTDRSIS